jgi:hypothetical protein
MNSAPNVVPVCYIHFLFKKQNKLGEERQSFISAYYGVSGPVASNSIFSGDTSPHPPSLVLPYPLPRKGICQRGRFSKVFA